MSRSKHREKRVVMSHNQNAGQNNNLLIANKFSKIVTNVSKRSELPSRRN